MIKRTIDGGKTAEKPWADDHRCGTFSFAEWSRGDSCHADVFAIRLAGHPVSHRNGDLGLVFAIQMQLIVLELERLCYLRDRENGCILGNIDIGRHGCEQTKSSVVNLGRATRDCRNGRCCCGHGCEGAAVLASIVQGLSHKDMVFQPVFGFFWDLTTLQSKGSSSPRCICKWKSELL